MSEEKNTTVVGEVGSITISEAVKSVGVLTLELNEIKTDISTETDKMLSKETSASNLLLIFNDLFGTQEKIFMNALKRFYKDFDDFVSSH